MKLMRFLSVLFAAATVLLAISIGRAQLDTSPMRLRNPATVRGVIGGESHNGYVIRARKGQTMTVRISWRREGDNHAEFSVRDSANLEYVDFGKETDNGKQWTGKIPRTGDYYIDVVAHPIARYTLRVTLK